MGLAHPARHLAEVEFGVRRALYRITADALLTGVAPSRQSRWDSVGFRETGALGTVSEATGHSGSNVGRGAQPARCQSVVYEPLLRISQYKGISRQESAGTLAPESFRAFSEWPIRTEASRKALRTIARFSSS
jgi:hypothetical protein